MKNATSMILNHTAMIAVALAAFGCAGGPKVEEVAVEKPQFRVLEAAPGGRELWLDNAHQFAIEMGKDKGFDTEKNYYYSGEGHSANQRSSCEQAQANVTDDVARQVAVFVDSSIARASSEGSMDSSAGVSAQSEVSEDMQRITSQLSKTSLHGVAQRKKYWEKRDYSQAGGAKSIYYCWVLTQVSKEDVEKLIQKASTLRLREDKALQAKVQDKLQNMGGEYEKYMEQH